MEKLKKILYDDLSRSHNRFLAGLLIFEKNSPCSTPKETVSRDLYFKVFSMNKPF